MTTSTPSLSLSQSQRLQMILAPQLRQSLEMLQLPVLELRNLIQQEMERNPTIEDALVNTEPLEIEPGAATAAPAGTPDDEKKPLDFDKEFEVLSKLDDEWRDYFSQDMANRPYTGEDAEKRQFLLDSRGTACGWVGHYLKETPGELEALRQAGKLTFPQAFLLDWLNLFRELTPEMIGRGERGK